MSFFEKEFEDFLPTNILIDLGKKHSKDSRKYVSRVTKNEQSLEMLRAIGMPGSRLTYQEFYQRFLEGTDHTTLMTRVVAFGYLFSAELVDTEDDSLVSQESALFLAQRP